MSIPSNNGSLQPRLVPRNGHTVLVLGIARISTEHQDQRSLADQEALYRGWLDRNVDQPYQLDMIAGRGSGEALDREDSRQAKAAVVSGRYDLVIAEDLGRIYRRAQALIFCELCEDNATRLIALNDQVDTAHDNWRALAGLASMRHEMYNADTAKRIRRTLRSRFQQGGVVQTTVFGYIKPTTAKTDAEMHKDPAAESVYAEMFRRLEDGASYSEVADWLNDHGIKPGPYARSPRWTCSMVTQLIHNWILKGVRVRNRKMTKRVNETGRHKSISAPPGERLERLVPHLAFIDAERYDRLIRMLDQRNAKFRRKGVDGVDTRKDVPKKRTVWPGQHLDCGICGRPFVYGAHGQKDHLMCRGARDYQCWNGVSVDGPLAAENLIAAIRAEIASLPDFDPQLIQILQEEVRQRQGSTDRRQQELARRLAAVERELQNLLAAVRAHGHSSSLLDDLSRVEQQKLQVEWEQQELAKVSNEPVTLPSLAEIRRLFDQSCGALAVASPEFGRMLRRLIPRIVVYPYRQCDGGNAVLRARFTLSLAALLPAPGLERLAAALERTMVVDLFESPQREAYRGPVLELTANGLKLWKIAWELDITQTAVQKAAALSRRMEKLGISDPYLPLTTPPDDDGRMRRHRHPRYRFEPLTSQDQEQPPLA